MYRTGLVGLLLRRKLRHRAIVVTYHRVLPRSLRRQSFSHDAIIVTPELFDRHLATLKRYFSCVDLAEFSGKLQSGQFSGRPHCLITFDDAWQDNHDFAFPILRRHGASAVIFVPTDYIGTGALFWQERLGHILHRLCRESPEVASGLLRDYGWSQLPVMAEDQRVEAIKSAIRDIKTKSYAEIDDMIAQLEAALSDRCEDYGVDAYLSVAQMREMQQYGISFQSHGRSHRVFTRLDQRELFEELEGSADWLEKNLGSRPMALAYPNGD
ncbi:MAG: polysaccharide deacetylase family protein, partial [Thiohalobacteraceae bacterium]